MDSDDPVSETFWFGLHNEAERDNCVVLWAASRTDPDGDPRDSRKKKYGDQSSTAVSTSLEIEPPQSFEVHLAKAIQNFVRKANPWTIPSLLATQLRFAIVDPGLDKQRGFPADPVVQAAIVQNVAARRADCLRQANRYPASFNGELQGGRLLLCAPNENVQDGASEYASKGFFDLNDTPPWDTWICFIESQLVSWVPPQLLAVANAGIDINAVECISWTQ